MQHPRDRGALAAVIRAGDLAIATSGTYERGDHPRWTLGLDGYEAVTVLDGDVVLSTPGFPVDEAGA